MANALIIAIAVLHIGFLVLEMFLWTKPVGLKIFRQSLEHAQISSVVAANQGLYNGFLAAGLIWSQNVANVEFAQQIETFFLSCVAVAGLYGAYTVSYRIFILQSVPALLALSLIWL
jgi:putative membrane protein